MTYFKDRAAPSPPHMVGPWKEKMDREIRYTIANYGEEETAAKEGGLSHKVRAKRSCLSSEAACDYSTEAFQMPYSTESCMEIGPWKYSGEIILLLVQTILKLFVGVMAFVEVMV